MKRLGKHLLTVVLALGLIALICLSTVDTEQAATSPSVASRAVNVPRETVQAAAKAQTEADETADILPAPQEETPDETGEPAEVTETPAQSAETAPKEPEPAVKTAEATAKTGESAPTVTLPASATSVLAVGLTKDDVNLRSGAGTGYTALTTLPSGTAVSVLGSSGGWLKVAYDGKTGYMSADFVTVQASASTLRCYGRVSTDELNVRTAPSVSAGRAFSLTQGTYVSVTGFENGWFAVTAEQGNGYVSGDYLALCRNKPAAVQQVASAGKSVQTTASAASAPGEEIVAYARTFLNVPYVYGGASASGFDCSGFTMYVMAHFGISLPHGSNEQYTKGTAVSYSDLQPGDLVFFCNTAYGAGPTTHVGIYVGGGQFIHASSYSAYNRVVITSFSSNGYGRDFVGARRFG